MEKELPVFRCRASRRGAKGLFFQQNRSSGAKGSLNLAIKDSFTCLSSGLIYCNSCLRFPAIGETGRTLRERFGEHFQSTNKNAPGFPVAKHFSSNGHTAAEALVRGIKLFEGTNRGRGRKYVSSFDSGHARRAASMLIFTSFEVHACVKNATFKF